MGICIIKYTLAIYTPVGCQQTHGRTIDTLNYVRVSMEEPFRVSMEEPFRVSMEESTR